MDIAISSKEALLRLSKPHFEQKDQAYYVLVETEEQVLAFMDKFQQELAQASSFEEANNCCQDDLKQLIIGVDCEGISRQRPLSLI